MPSITRVAVVDDDDHAALTIMHALEDGKFKPYRQEAMGSVQELVDSILASSDAAICDHRLRYGAFADVSGAELASRLMSADHPAIVVTQYLDQYADVDIRQFRGNLPVVLRRDQADEPSELRDAFAKCLHEISKGRVENRKPQRTLLRVEQITHVNGEAVIDAVVHGWNSKDTVRFPMSLVHPDDATSVREQGMLSALTNLRAEDKVELFFEDVRVVADPDEDDGL
ncbi:hypothetical protein I5V61_01090 [Stenotrophomonas maltophilia]|jgi:CheY-like chemotaxis protein|uniref:hypothetical protein n=1 Tax=Stenotrophomonas geniculata TaxID=86188 RepID=UPI0018D2E967|nr:hypothetical protein [Stenotrophomonas maltophilia]